MCNKKVYRLDLLIENIEYTASLSHVQPTSFLWPFWLVFHWRSHLLIRFEFFKKSWEIDICHLIIRILLVKNHMSVELLMNSDPKIRCHCFSYRDSSRIPLVEVICSYRQETSIILRILEESDGSGILICKADAFAF